MSRKEKNINKKYKSNMQDPTNEPKENGTEGQTTTAAAETSKKDVEYINLKVKSQDGNEIYFKIKRTTQLKKLMDAYCDRQGCTPQTVRFLFDGERLQETATPEKLEMEDGDEIDAMVEQIGGSH
mmetsp:Transcript_24267/g.27513  ORF Transcript_24267/g.27513 Transcript_24267/m.27513 type:complete len:125 (+) Transcript_24267:133-507(+)